jgi:hypothetical protein
MGLLSRHAVPSADWRGDDQVARLIEVAGVRAIHCGDTIWHGRWYELAARVGPSTSRSYRLTASSYGSTATRRPTFRQRSRQNKPSMPRSFSRLEQHARSTTDSSTTLPLPRATLCRRSLPRRRQAPRRRNSRAERRRRCHRLRSASLAFGRLAPPSKITTTPPRLSPSLCAYLGFAGASRLEWGAAPRQRRTALPQSPSRTRAQVTAEGSAG